MYINVSLFFSTQETSLNKICLPAGSNNACEQIPSSWLHVNMDVLPGVTVPVFIEFIGLTAVLVRVENRTSKRAKKKAVTYQCKSSWLLHYSTH